MLSIEVQQLAESTSSSEKLEPGDVHELCGHHDAESRQVALRRYGEQRGRSERLLLNGRRLPIQRALAGGGGVQRGGIMLCQGTSALS